MNQVHRDGVDIGIAFASSAKRIISQAFPPDVEHNSVHLEHPLMAENVNVPKQSKAGVFGCARKRLRPIVRLVYRLFRPISRPIAFRLRLFLTEALHQDVLRLGALSLQEQQKMSAVLLREMQTVRESLRQDIFGERQRVFAGMRQELRQMSVAVLREMQVDASNPFPRLDRVEQYGCAGRRVAIACDLGEILVKAEVGYVFCPASDHAMLACLVDTGEFERGTRLLIQRMLSPGDVFVDIGASLGFHTLAAAGAMQGSGKIIAFEPFEPSKRLLEKSVWLNGFSGITEIHHAAVSNITGHQELFLGVRCASNGNGARSVDVPVVRLDERIIQSCQKVNLIKIDAEGGELEVLESAAAVIKRNPGIALVVKFRSAHLKRADRSTQHWLSAFTDLGLCYRAINPDTGGLEDWSLEQLENSDSVNLFFARANSPAWTKADTTT